MVAVYVGPSGSEVSELLTMLPRPSMAVVETKFVAEVMAFVVVTLGDGVEGLKGASS